MNTHEFSNRLESPGHWIADRVIGQPTVIIYHADCADGFTSAWVAQRSRPDTVLIPARYAEPPPEILDDFRGNVMILDFSYPRDVMKSLIADPDLNVIVLDHHSDRADPEAGQKYVADLPGVRITDQYSGAGFIASLDGFQSPLVDYVQDRDLWNHTLPHTKEINARIQAEPFTVENWDALHNELTHSMADVIRMGSILLRAKRKRIDAAKSRVYDVILAGYYVPCVNGVEKDIVSEVVGELSEGHPFAVTWAQHGADQYVYSFRSRNSGVDVSAVAHRFGGGGHTQASGATTREPIHHGVTERVMI
jgi:oligoribonuclease NrnB/cAMP/cGMP phosphodiesterase (DHH superfamily)